jgi:aminobenzoyl-glutamate utilization protein B
MDKPFVDECESLISPQDAGAALREHLARGRRTGLATS